MAADGPKILIVEDEPEMRRFLRAALKHAGYRLAETGTVQDARALALDDRLDLILLDLGLPDGDGLDVIDHVRQRSQLPIIVLSARNQESGKVQALDRGADDYLTKPFFVNELLARVRVALRHAALRRQDNQALEFQTGDLRVDLFRRQVFIQGNEVRFTPIEFRLLSMLIQNAGRVVPHRQVLEEVWGPRAVDSHYVRIVVASIRKKIEDDSSRPKYLISEAGVGYRLVSECATHI